VVTRWLSNISHDERLPSPSAATSDSSRRPCPPRAASRQAARNTPSKRFGATERCAAAGWGCVGLHDVTHGIREATIQCPSGSITNPFPVPAVMLTGKHLFFVERNA
jgi:hypothetical protein